jgi:hypothetical protein
MLKTSVCCAVFLLSLATASFAQDICDSVAGNIVANCGFEDNSGAVAPTDWTLTPASSGSLFFIGALPPYGAYSGSNAANFAAFEGLDDTISQTLPTLAGATYDLTFYLAHATSDSANDFSADWNGVSVYSLVNANQFPYTEVNIPDLVAIGSDTLSFAGSESVLWYDLDSVAVVETAAPVPEPSSLVLLFSVTVILGLAWRRRSRPQAAK